MLKKKKIYNCKYEKLQKLGEGAYGVVYKVAVTEEESKDESQKKFYALKKFYLDHFKDGMNFTALREITILKEINHENVVKIVDTFYGGKNLFIAYEFVETDLTKIVFNKSIALTEKLIKGIMFQILLGLNEIHKFNVIHRDIKPDNILVSKNGAIKIADFGMARIIASPGRAMTRNIVTRWYRPPEIFFGAKFYSFAVDMWGIGCILAELYQKKPLFTGNNDFETLAQIFSVTGVADESVWPGCNELPNFIPFSEGDVEPINKRFNFAGKECIDLLENLIVLDPNKRLSAEAALNHTYFRSEPSPATKEEIMSVIGL